MIELKVASVLILSFLVIGIIFEVFSYLLFEGLFASLSYTCGSACEIWPGIPTSQICILVCVPRNSYYFLFFIIGTVIIAFSLILLVFKYK